MRVRTILCVLVLLLPGSWAGSAWGQATKDQARLVFTVSGGVVLGRSLWSVAAQPVQFITPADTFALSRRIRSSLGIGFAGAYFPGDHLGFAADGFLIGLGFEDGCRMVFSSGNSDVVSACESIQGATKSATAVALTGGPIYRFNSRSLFAPYVRANLGLVFSNQSSIRTVGHFTTPGGISDLIVYDDDHESRVEPMLGLGAGVTAAIGPGYQLRWEVRDNITGVQKVTAPTAEARVVPPHKVEYKHLFSIAIGFDVVLERRRGRRY
jgi:hypothetical protein